MLKEVLDNRSDLQKHLFVRGFLITTRNFSSQINFYPFYNNWKQYELNDLYFIINNKQSFFYLEENGKTLFLIGHAYNPFTLEHDENTILQSISLLVETEMQDYIDGLTGLFIFGVIENKNIVFQLDCSGMQYGCYGLIENQLYIASHMQLIGDINNLEFDDYVSRLINYRWYKYMMGNYLPGDLTAFSDIKRIIPNTKISFMGGKFEINRFYPKNEIKMCETEEEYKKVIEEASIIMKNNMFLISKKWEKPAISLTGGIDSNTTFASANGLYDKFETFSYISMYRESVDAEAAKQISDNFNVKHKVYTIPEKNEELVDFEIYKEILSHNDGDIGPTKDDDTRKKIYLMQNDVCEIEVKSWISETIRAYVYKYFGRKKMPKKLKARQFTSLYKIFLLNRKLVNETDKYFDEYFKKTNLKNQIFNYDNTDFFVWEMMHGGKCGLNIGTMKFCFNITIPYNNRKLLDLLLRVDLPRRINDQHHLDLKKIMNKELYDLGIRVVNLNETKERKRMINMYYTINTHLPF